ncbi:MAG: SUMF1/EgtB/PvdO family nonheme iron enzyme, partial [Treponema sp.]|nr:SUMF1/EgtB/PvdO family nonheme iron enzyme [Treponema sp.]
MKNIFKLLGFITLIIIGFAFISCPEPGLTALTGTVSISGHAQVGQTLTAETDNLGGSGTISYEWRRDGTTVIGNDSTYTIQNEDIGSTITLTITRSDNSGSVTSTQTTVVVNSNTATLGLAFTLINNGAAYSVSRGTSTASVVIIPLVYEGLPVTEIADSGFSTYTNLTSVIIPDAVTKIGNHAFFNCGNLKSVVIPAGTTNIGDFVFFNCANLDTIFYGGADNAAWSAISIGSNNTPLAGASRIYYSPTNPEIEKSTYWRFVNSVPLSWNFIGIEMVYVPSGSFELGRNLGTGGGGNVTPISTVSITGFYMSKYQITQEQYQTVMGTNPSYFHGGTGREPASGEEQGRRPVEQVSWYDALVFCNRLSIMEGLTPAYSISGSTNPNDWGTVPTSSNATWDAVQIVSGSTGYRLPTEAQWEYAAKGGNGSPGNFTYSGSNDPNLVAWYLTNSGSRTHEVGKKAPNGLGIYDMSGNVWEWCWDRWGSYTSTTKTDPMGAPSG